MTQKKGIITREHQEEKAKVFVEINRLEGEMKTLLHEIAYLRNCYRETGKIVFQSTKRLRVGLIKLDHVRKDFKRASLDYFKLKKERGWR